MTKGRYRAEKSLKGHHLGPDNGKRLPNQLRGPNASDSVVMALLERLEKLHEDLLETPHTLTLLSTGSMRLRDSIQRPKIVIIAGLSRQHQRRQYRFVVKLAIVRQSFAVV